MNIVLTPARQNGWRMGFANLFQKENRDWWRTRSWLIHLIIVLLVVGGTVLGVLFAPIPPEEAAQAELNGSAFDLSDPASAATNLFVIVGGLYMGVVAVIVMQDTLIGEKHSGTAAWVLSKPASRTAFMLAKLLANSLALAVILVIIPGMVVFAALASLGAAPALVAWAAGLAVLVVNLLFYVTLTLMLGTLFDTRGPVIGLPLFILFGWQVLASIAPSLLYLLPIGLTMPINTTDLPLAVAALQGLAITNTLPLLTTVAWSIVFVAIAFWRFRREEL